MFFFSLNQINVQFEKSRNFTNLNNTKHYLLLQTESPDREVYRDPDIIRAEEQVEDSVIAKESHTTTKVLNKFRQMEENQHREPLNLGK